LLSLKEFHLEEYSLMMVVVHLLHQTQSCFNTPKLYLE
jgi:hypothetical protein